MREQSWPTLEEDFCPIRVLSAIHPTLRTHFLPGKVRMVAEPSHLAHLMRVVAVSLRASSTGLIPWGSIWAVGLAWHLHQYRLQGVSGTLLTSKHQVWWETFIREE